ncbi:hypothetical protein [Methyloradius palustris]|uniref:Uncharacterized protein n=1 Tax=Methyloradius palustris TaxID=2778876 RepID=A0A8D5JZJ3_9PROT|nr:hypothetical protein [Methyloradius palustris]BCM25722.1 hypothetical protein ZMTM_19810 [Methyloradius palustris]
MNEGIRKSLIAISASMSVLSGVLWKVSAESQLRLLENLTPENYKSFAILSANENLWAAYFAAGAGVTLAVAVFFET